jgi:hypothetical protein
VRPGGHNSPYTRIQELAEELETISHSNVEQERLKEILRSTAIQIQDEKAHSKQPARSNSQRQDNQSQWRSAFDRLGLTKAATKEAEKTRTKVIELNEQGITGADHQFLQLH